MSKKNAKFKNISNRTIVYLAAGGVALIVLVFLIAGFFTKNSTPVLDNTPQSESRTLSGATVAEDKDNVLNSAVSLLNLTNIVKPSVDKNSAANEVEKISTANVDMNKIGKLVDFSGYNDESQNTIIQSLATFSYSIIKNTEGSASIIPAGSASDIILKEDLGIAFVPLSVITGSDNAFNLMFVWNDGAWKLLPYPLIEQVKMMAFK